MSEKSNHPKGRKWQLTINNPLSFGLDRSSIIGILDSMKLDYYCLCDEVGLENNTPHTHIYIYRKNNIRFETIKKKFNVAHIEWCFGTSTENRDYIRKEGKYAESEKKETNLIETFYEHGELPEDSNKKADDKRLLQSLIDEGHTNEEIIRQYPQFTYRLKDIDEIRNTLRFTKYRTEDRNVTVMYLSGKTATGKSKFVHDRFDASEIYVVSDYEHPFDNYTGQRAIVFDEFRSSLKYSDMLQYLDKYPCQLKARYANKWACYEYVFIISNIPLEDQYKRVFEDRESQEAFYRRINYVLVFEKEYFEQIDYTDYKIYCYKGNVDLDKMMSCPIPEIKRKEEAEDETEDELV